MSEETKREAQRRVAIAEQLLGFGSRRGVVSGLSCLSRPRTIMTWRVGVIFMVFIFCFLFLKSSQQPLIVPCP